MNDATISIDEIVNSWLFSHGKTIHSYMKCLSFAAQGIRELALSSLPMLQHAVITREPDKPWFLLPEGFTDYVRVGVRFGDRFRPIGVSNRLMPYPRFGNGGSDLDGTSLGDGLNTATPYQSWYAGTAAMPAGFNDADFAAAYFATVGTNGQGDNGLLPVPGISQWLGDGSFPDGLLGGIRTDSVVFDLNQNLILCYEEFPYSEIVLTYIGVGSVDNMTSIPVIAQAAIEAYIDYKWAAVKRNNNADAQYKKSLFDDQHYILRARKTKWATVDIKRAFADKRTAYNRITGGFSGGITGGRIVETVFVDNPSPNDTDVKIYTFKIGNAPATGYAPDGTFANGSSFQSNLLIGKAIEVRVGSVPLSPEAGGYSFNTTTGTITFDSIIEDTNIYIIATTQTLVPVVNNVFPFTFQYNFS